MRAWPPTVSRAAVTPPVGVSLRWGSKTRTRWGSSVGGQFTGTPVAVPVHTYEPATGSSGTSSPACIQLPKNQTRSTQCSGLAFSQPWGCRYSMRTSTTLVGARAEGPSGGSGWKSQPAGHRRDDEPREASARVPSWDAAPPVCCPPIGRMIASRALAMVDAERPLVLVIDDDSDLRRICLDMLGARGYRTQGAASVGEGLRAFGERQPAVVLLDLKLPDGTGLDVLRELQRRSPVTPVVVVSGYGSVKDAVEAMRLGASEYIEKPVAKERLYDVLDRVLAPVPRREDAPGGAGGGRRPVRDGRPLRGHAARLPAGGHGGAHAGARHDLGRARHGQGAGGPRDPRALPPSRPALRADELRRGAGRAHRERDVRPREGGVHRRGGGPARDVRERGRRAPSSWTRSAT